MHEIPKWLGSLCECLCEELMRSARNRLLARERRINGYDRKEIVSQLINFPSAYASHIYFYSLKMVRSTVSQETDFFVQLYYIPTGSWEEQVI